MRTAPRPRTRLWRALRAIPATWTMLALLLLAGVAGAGLWRPLHESPVWDAVAYGLPVLAEGRWWTPVTGAFFVDPPWVYVLALSGFVGMAYLEWRRGSAVALAYFWAGQLLAVLVSAGLLWLCAMTGWPWAVAQAGALDVGPSGGTMACLAAAAGLLSGPWRVRAWTVLIAFVFVAVLFWGRLPDLEHAVAVLLVLAFDHSLRIRRTTLREQRLIAYVAMLALGAIGVIVAIAPTDGLFGPTKPLSGPFWSTAVDVVVVLVIADGLRRARRWAWVVALVLATLNVAYGALLLGLLVLTGRAAVQDALGSDPAVDIATAVLWLLVLVYLIAVRRAFRWRRRAVLGRMPQPDRDEVRRALQTHGGGTLSWMTTWEPNAYARTADGIVAYQRRAGVALALADPLGEASTRAASVAEFVRAAEHAGLVPCFFSADEATRAAVPPGWRSLVVADDTIVDLPGLAFTGKRFGPIRTAMNRAEREGVTFRMTRLRDETWGVRAQLQAISQLWVGDKGLPEMRFTLGTLAEADDPEVRVALAVSPDGDVDGFLSWLPVYGQGSVRGWTLDLMRRREGGFPPVMEYLIAMSAQHFRDEGAQLLSLSGAPLTHEYPPDADAIAKLSERLADLLEPVYGFGSLHRFKQKFHPRFESLYLLYRDESDLTRIAAALTRAFLPDATLRQFAGAGLELVRSSG
ncbi:bifunctional lysylphosphatidylglycerol flippase/synthetase MprF [Microbacterium luticocti]|uniref:bifunctional lysylphosphatidylglycerol flippase/synthetase MprF n=1 Tax=Microbacterium luticocti TaxID=451764 RepID=UPI00055FB918|nr:DUF2156 domain-containing protein [Microbacterium luticocti]